MLAPTGTISFMMDCDTTGIEPDIALVKYKQLAGGGMLKIVNQTVPLALETLGYDQPQIESILAYIDEHDTIEGAPDVKDEHLAVFDCAFQPRNGTRSIAWQAHVRMMAAAQPFLSGAISKTVNMPRDTTPDDIAKAYFEGWQLGLKALAIYRDGSKESQPLSTSTEGDKAAAKQPCTSRAANACPILARSITHKFSVAGHEGYITVGLYRRWPPGRAVHHDGQRRQHDRRPDGLPSAPAVSMSLQYGVPLEVLREQVLAHAVRADGATPRTPTSASPRASSTTSSAGWASRSCPATKKPATASLPKDDSTAPGSAGGSEDTESHSTPVAKKAGGRKQSDIKSRKTTSETESAAAAEKHKLSVTAEVASAPGIRRGFAGDEAASHRQERPHQRPCQRQHKRQRPCQRQHWRDEGNQRSAPGPRRHHAQRRPAPTRPAASNSPISNPMLPPATTAAASPSAPATATSATTAAAAWAAADT